IVSVAQGANALATHIIIGIAADEAIGGGNGAAEARAPVAPGHGAAIAVPGRTGNHVIAVAQGCDADHKKTGIVAAHIIIGIAADEAIRGGDGTTNSRATVAPGCRPALAVPLGTIDHVVAVGQQRDALTTRPITGVAADQGTDETPTQPIKEIHSAR